MYSQLLKLSPRKVAQILTRARQVQRVSGGIYHADAVAQTLMEVEISRVENRRQDAENMRRHKFGA